MKVTDLHPLEELEYLRKVISEYKTSNTLPFVFHHVCKDGSILTVECRTQETELDGIPSILVLADDITEKRKAQESMLFQSGVLKNVRDTIFVTDRKGIITYWNEGAEKSFGYKNVEIIGRNFDLLYAEVDKLKTRSEQNEILAGRISQWEAKLITKEDKIVWVDIKASYMFDDAGQVTGIVRVCKDVTQSRFYSEKQKETVATLNSIFNTVNQSIVLLDNVKRIKAFNIIANRQFIQLMGIELQESAFVNDYLLQENWEIFDEKFNLAMQDQQVQWD
jgi:PAS domain S-box-containing protein